MRIRKSEMGLIGIESQVIFLDNQLLCAKSLFGLRIDHLDLQKVGTRYARPNDKG